MRMMLDAGVEGDPPPKSVKEIRERDKAEVELTNRQEHSGRGTPIMRVKISVVCYEIDPLMVAAMIVSLKRTPACKHLDHEEPDKVRDIVLHGVNTISQYFCINIRTCKGNRSSLCLKHIKPHRAASATYTIVKTR